MTPDEIAKERADVAQRSSPLTYVVTFTEMEYVAVLRAVMAADVAGAGGVHLSCKDALVRAEVRRDR